MLEDEEGSCEMMEGGVREECGKPKQALKKCCVGWMYRGNVV